MAGGMGLMAQAWSAWGLGVHQPPPPPSSAMPAHACMQVTWHTPTAPAASVSRGVCMPSSAQRSLEPAQNPAASGGSVPPRFSVHPAHLAAAAGARARGQGQPPVALLHARRGAVGQRAGARGQDREHQPYVRQRQRRGRVGGITCELARGQGNRGAHQRGHAPAAGRGRPAGTPRPRRGAPGRRGHAASARRKRGRPGTGWSSWLLCLHRKCCCVGGGVLGRVEIEGAQRRLAPCYMAGKGGPWRVAASNCASDYCIPTWASASPKRAEEFFLRFVDAEQPPSCAALGRPTATSPFTQPPRLRPMTHGSPPPDRDLSSGLL